MAHKPRVVIDAYGQRLGAHRQRARHIAQAVILSRQARGGQGIRAGIDGTLCSTAIHHFAAQGGSTFTCDKAAVGQAIAESVGAAVVNFGRVGGGDGQRRLCHRDLWIQTRIAVRLCAFGLADLVRAHVIDIGLVEQRSHLGRSRSPNHQGRTHFGFIAIEQARQAAYAVVGQGVAVNHRLVGRTAPRHCGLFAVNDIEPCAKIGGVVFGGLIAAVAEVAGA